MKRNTGKKVLALVLALCCLTALLTGCGDKDDSGSGGVPASGTVYVPSYEDLDIGLGDFNVCGSNGNLLYLNVWDYGDGIAEDEPMPLAEAEDVAVASGSDIMGSEDPTVKLYSYDLESKALTQLKDYQNPEDPEQYKSYANLEGSTTMDRCMLDNAGNLWVLESGWYGYYEGEGYEDYQELGRVTLLRQLDASGAETKRIDLTSLGEDQEYFYINNVVFNQEGNAVIAAEGDTSAIYVLDETGTVKSENTYEGWVDSMFSLPDGTILVKGYWGETQGVRTVGTDGKLIDSAEMPDSFNNAYNVYPGNGDYQFYYYGQGDNFYGHKAGAAEDELILNWLNCDVDSSNLNTILPRENGSFLVLSTSWTESGMKAELITMTPTPASEVPQKTTLTLACQYMDDSIRRAALEFNKKNADYRIAITDYSQYNTEDDYEAGLTKLTTEILGGQVPDILLTSNLPVDRYMARGLLEDLYPYLDGDTELGGREAIVPSALKALEVDGKLSQVAASMYIQTVAGSTASLNGMTSWTPAEMLAFSKTLPSGGQSIFGPNYSREDILQTCVAFDAGYYIDWSTGECRFDSEDFAAMLEFAAGFPSQEEMETRYEDPNYEWESDMARVKRGEQLLLQVGISDFIYGLADVNYAFGETDLTFIGFPVSEGTGHVASFDAGLAMSATCKYQDGAWAFIRTVLTENYQEENSWSIPTNQKVFNEKLKEACTPEYYTDPTTGEQKEQSKGGIGWGDGETVEVYALTDAQAQTIRNLVNSVERTFSYDHSILDIITEEAAPFFAGQKTAQQAAELVQSRMSLYVNEQK